MKKFFAFIAACAILTGNSIANSHTASDQLGHLQIHAAGLVSATVGLDKATMKIEALGVVESAALLMFRHNGWAIGALVCAVLGLYVTRKRDTRKVLATC